MDSSAPVAAPLPLTEALIEPLQTSDAASADVGAQIAQVGSENPPLTEALLVNKFPYVAIWILATLSLIAALQFSYAFTVPLISAILLHYALGKPVNWLGQVGLPRSIGAALVMCAALAVTGSLFYGLWGQAENLLESLPRSAKRISNDFVKMRQAPGGTLRKVGEAAAAVTDMVNGQPATAKPKPAPAAAPEAVNTFLIKGSVSALASLATAAGIILLAYFLLTAGDHFRRRLVKATLSGHAPRHEHYSRNIDIHRAVYVGGGKRGGMGCDGGAVSHHSLFRANRHCIRRVCVVV